ncbi:MAG: pitrilysin family protein [Candidatus Woesearchaeota archaeon]
MKKSLLSNGITLLVEKRPANTANVLVTVKTGSNFESPKEKGVSHFVEHILFEGTKTRSAIEITRAIEGIGGEIGAFTTNEEICFYVRVLPRHLATALDVLSDILKNPSFVDIEKERKIILSEIRMKHDEPRFFQWELFMKTLFPNHPVGSPISGTLDTVASITKEMIVDYYKKNFIANNMIVAYVGPNKGAEPLIKKFFSGLVPARKSLRKAFVFPARKNRSSTVLRNMSQSYLMFGFRTVARSNKDSYALDVVRSLLGRGLSGRLVHEIRTKRALAYEVGCHHESDKKYGFFAVYLNTDKKSLPKCLQIIRQEIRGLNNISPSELTEAKNFLEGEFVMETEDPQRYAVAISLWEYFGLGTGLKAYVANIGRVRIADVKRVARKYLGKGYSLALVKQK